MFNEKAKRKRLVQKTGSSNKDLGAIVVIAVGCLVIVLALVLL